MIKAIYKLRSDGDYDFVAAFESEQLPEPPSNWPAEIIEWLKAEGETPLLIQNSSCNFPDVWDGQKHENCKHQFQDSEHCLICGWTPIN